MVVPLLSLGGSGYISVLSNVAPKDATEMSRAALEGDWDRARELQLSTKPLTDALFCDVNPIPVKAALALMGKIEMGYRMPLCPPSDANLEKIRQALVDYGIL
jgi:4-hydroxy-tetrahydrodipicolinate synthase